MRKKGYYWVRISDEWTIGYYDGSKSYPWQVVGSDEIWKEGQSTSLEPKIDEVKEERLYHERFRN